VKAMSAEPGRQRLTAAIAVVGGAAVTSGAALPWLTVFSGLRSYPGIAGLNGRVLAAGGAAAIMLAVWYAIRGQVGLRYAIGATPRPASWSAGHPRLARHHRNRVRSRPSRLRRLGTAPQARPIPASSHAAGVGAAAGRLTGDHRGHRLCRRSSRALVTSLANADASRRLRKPLSARLGEETFDERVDDRGNGRRVLDVQSMRQAQDDGQIDVAAHPLGLPCLVLGEHAPDGGVRAHQLSSRQPRGRRRR
jgi:hypothetical protein